MLRTYAIWGRKRWVLAILGFVSLVRLLAIYNAAVAEYKKICSFGSRQQSQPRWNSILCNVVSSRPLNVPTLTRSLPDFPAIFPQIEHCLVKGANIISVAYIFLLCSETSSFSRVEPILHLTLTFLCA
jgi:hypothetical protein